MIEVSLEASLVPSGFDQQKSDRHSSVIALSLVEKIVNWVEPAFISAGYLIIAAGVLCERSILVGLVVPGDLILALGGVYSAQHRMDLVAVIVVGVLAAIAGESIGYWLGRRYGRRLLRRIPLLRRLEDRLTDAEAHFKKHGGKTVFLGRYATAIGAFVPFTAGMGKMPYRRFLAFDIPAITIWATAISIFGYFFGRNLRFVDKVLSRFGYFVAAIALGYFVGRSLWKKWRSRKAPTPG
jgi:membrane-associated protein